MKSTDRCVRQQEVLNGVNQDYWSYYLGGGRIGFSAVGSRTNKRTTWEWQLNGWYSRRYAEIDLHQAAGKS